MICIDISQKYTNVQQEYENIFHLLITKEIKMKTTMTYYFTPFRMFIIKSTKNKAWCGGAHLKPCSLEK
jgi:hypothetical protein